MTKVKPRPSFTSECEFRHVGPVTFGHNEGMRKSDTDNKPHPRKADRVFDEQGEWFVRTREGVRGPFRTRQQAEAELRLYVDTMSFLEENRASMPSHLDWGDVTVVDVDEPRWR